MTGKGVEGGLEEGGCRPGDKLGDYCLCPEQASGVRIKALASELRHWQWEWRRADTRNIEDLT